MTIDGMRELDKQIAEKYGEYGEVYEVDDELYGIVGMDVRTYFTIGHAFSPVIEIIPHYCTDMFEALRLEKLIEKQELLEEYISALIAEGGERKSATAEQRCRAALKVPYVAFPAPPQEETLPPAPQVPAPLIELEDSEETLKTEEEVVETTEAVEESVATPEAEEDAPQLPEDWWLTYGWGERVPLVFYDDKGQLIETIEAVWEQDNIFGIYQAPLRIDGVSLDDSVEVRWEEGDLTPIFVRVKEKFGYKTIRADVSSLKKRDRSSLMNSLFYNIYNLRLVGDVLVITYRDDPGWIVEELINWGIPWKFTDPED